MNNRAEGALEVTGVSGTSIILTALKRGTTYYIWVVGVSEGGEGPHSDRMSGVTYDSELPSTNCVAVCCILYNYYVFNSMKIIIFYKHKDVKGTYTLQVTMHQSSNSELDRHLLYILKLTEHASEFISEAIAILLNSPRYGRNL